MYLTFGVDIGCPVGVTTNSTIIINMNFLLWSKILILILRIGSGIRTNMNNLCPCNISKKYIDQKPKK